MLERDLAPPHRLQSFILCLAQHDATTALPAGTYSHDQHKHTAQTHRTTAVTHLASASSTSLRASHCALYALRRPDTSSLYARRAASNSCADAGTLRGVIGASLLVSKLIFTACSRRVVTEAGAVHICGQAQHGQQADRRALPVRRTILRPLTAPWLRFTCRATTVAGATNRLILTAPVPPHSRSIRPT